MGPTGSLLERFRAFGNLQDMDLAGQFTQKINLLPIGRVTVGYRPDDPKMTGKRFFFCARPVQPSCAGIERFKQGDIALPAGYFGETVIQSRILVRFSMHRGRQVYRQDR